MNIYNLLPKLNGYKTALGSLIQVIVGLLVAAVEFLSLANDCLNGVQPLDACFDNLPLALMGVLAAANGLAQFGLGHKLIKASE